MKKQIVIEDTSNLLREKFQKLIQQKQAEKEKQKKEESQREDKPKKQ